MGYQTVRLVSTFGSGSCVSSFGSSPKVETAEAFPVLGLHTGVLIDYEHIRFGGPILMEAISRFISGIFQ